MSGKGFMKNKGFSMIPNQVIWDEDISNDAKLLFCYLRSLSEKYRTLRNKTLLYKLGISLNTLQNCKAELIKNGYLKVIRKTWLCTDRYPGYETGQARGGQWDQGFSRGILGEI